MVRTRMRRTIMIAAALAAWVRQTPQSTIRCGSIPAWFPAWPRPHPTCAYSKAFRMPRRRSGDLRWRAPKPAAHWEGIRKADAFGPVCMQGNERQ